MPWFIIQPNPELRKYRLLYSVTRPPKAVGEFEEYGEAARGMGELQKSEDTFRWLEERIFGEKA